MVVPNRDREIKMQNQIENAPDEKQTKTLDEAFADGWFAKETDVCPYTPNDELYIEWMSGYDAGNNYFN
jgi:hypothetical protein